MGYKYFYLDAAATTAMHPHVVEEMKKAINEFGNPSSVYSIGRKARMKVDIARCLVAEMIGAEPDEIVFTSGATESNNTVINHFNYLFSEHVATSKVEHPSVFEPSKAMSSSNPYRIQIERNGEINSEDINIVSLRNTLAPVAASVMLANNETGLIHDIKALDHSVSALHTDITQYVPHYAISVHDFLGRDMIDFASFSAHKFGGPKGVGALFVNRSFNHDDPTPIAPYLWGGGQEMGLRSGTENVLGIVGMGAAAEVMIDSYDNGKEMERVQRFSEILLDCVPMDCTLNFEPGIPVFSLHVPHVSNSGLVMQLDVQRVYISAGSACHGDSVYPSRVLAAMGLTNDEALSTVRISPPDDMPEDDFFQACTIIGSTIQQIRSL